MKNVFTPSYGSTSFHGNEENLPQLFAATSKLQEEVLQAQKDAKNEYSGYEYSTLEACWSALRKGLTKNGLSVLQPVECVVNDKNEHFVRLNTVLTHSAGAWLHSEMMVQAIPIKGMSMVQAVGLTTTYLRRYALCAVTGLVQSEDDGASLGGYEEPVEQIETLTADEADILRTRLEEAARESRDAMKAVWGGLKPKEKAYMSANPGILDEITALVPTNQKEEASASAGE